MFILLNYFLFPIRLQGVKPEATGLRHIAFEVNDIEATVAELAKHHVIAEAIRIDDLPTSVLLLLQIQMIYR